MNGKYVGAVQQFYDGILERSPHVDDRSLVTDTPLFPNALSVDGSEWPPPFAEYTGEVYANMALQGPLLRGLASLSRLTGDARYRRGADDSLRFLVSRYQ